MKTLIALTMALATILGQSAFAAEGLIAEESPFSVSETMDRLDQNVRERGLNVFARIDHAAGAQQAGMALRPTQLLIFGNPQGGTPLMQCAQTAGIDLPMKMLVWEDENGQVWLGYNDLDYLAGRHHAGQCPVVENLAEALAGIMASTLSP